MIMLFFGLPMLWKFAQWCLWHILNIAQRQWQWWCWKCLDLDTFFSGHLILPPRSVPWGTHAQTTTSRYKNLRTLFITQQHLLFSQCLTRFAQSRIPIPCLLLLTHPPKPLCNSSVPIQLQAKIMLTLGMEHGMRLSIMYSFHGIL